MLQFTQDFTKRFLGALVNINIQTHTKGNYVKSGYVDLLDYSNLFTMYIKTSCRTSYKYILQNINLGFNK